MGARLVYDERDISYAGGRTLNFFHRIIQGKIDEVKDWNDPNREETPMPCPEITIPDVPQELYDKLLGEATAAGVHFDGTVASIEGAQFDWNYDAPSTTLRVTCLKKPFFISCDSAEKRIRELVERAKGGI